MPINPSIAMGVKGIELENPLNQFAKFAQIQNAQRENALAQMKMDEYNRSLDEQNRLRAYLQGSDVTTPEGRKGLIQFGKTGLELSKTLLEQEKEAALRKKAEVEGASERKKLLDSSMRDISQRPSDANITAWREDIQASPHFSAEEKAAIVKREQQLLSVPFEQRVALLASQGASAGELKPTITTQNLGGTVQAISTPAFGGSATVVPGSVGTVTMTPYQIEQNKIAKGQLAVSQGHLKVAQDRLKEEGIKLSAEDDNLLATAIAEGRVDVNKVNGRNAKYLVGALKAQPGIDLREMSIENIASGAGARALGVQTAKMQTAAIEADKMIDIVRTTSAAIDRTQFPTINAIQNAVDKGTGGREIVQLNTAINSLVNSYARAISPTGQPTVSDKNHAREVINSAYSNGQIDAITDIMRQEMAIAKASPKEAQEAAREMRKGETKTPSVSPQDKQALDWANANPGDPRAAKIKATLGVK